MHSKLAKVFLIVVFLQTAFASATFAMAKEMHLTHPDALHALMIFLGGLTILLYGLRKITAGFKALAGDKLRNFLSSLTSNRIKGVLAGIGVTSIVQSSSATTMMVVSFISARMMNLSQALTVILGADIGTTITVQLIAFKVNQYALIPITLGFFIKAISKEDHVWQIGRVLMATGFIFFGIFMITESVGTLYNIDVVAKALAHTSNPFVAILFGVMLTALTYSSAAALAIVIALASQGILDLQGVMAMVLGANIGSAVTSCMISFGGRVDAIRTAAAHLTFKVTGTLLVFAFLPLITEGLIHFYEMTGTPVDTGSPRQVAHMHMLFNIFVALLFLPFINILANGLSKLIPQIKTRHLVKAEFLDPFLLSTPKLALNTARQEATHMARRVCSMMRTILPPLLDGDTQALSRIRLMEREVDALYNQIIDYLSALSRNHLTEEESKEILWIMGCATRLENVSDLIGVDLCTAARTRSQNGVKISKATQQVLTEMHELALKTLTQSTKLLLDDDEEKAEKILITADQEEFKNMVENGAKHQAKRLGVDEPNRFEAYALEMDIQDKLQRIYHHGRKIARKTIDFQGE